MINAYAAHEPGGKLLPFEYDPGELGPEDVEIAVEACGICHSDLSMLYNEWGMTTYPLVPGHEVAGTVAAVGERVTNLKVGQRVGLGWQSGSCGVCEWCLSGDHILCPHSEATIVGRHGGFADRVRAMARHVIPLPVALPSLSTGPLFCGGLTVFNPLVQFDIKPTARVGVVGIGGLGHLALQFLHAWGCDVTAFTSSPEKAEAALRFGANHILNSRDPQALQSRSFDMILSTASADLDWARYLAALRPKGRLHFVGIAPKPVVTQVFSLVDGQKSISGSPTGSPATLATMLDFVVRHAIEPAIEVFPFSQINEAMEHLRHGKARYRVVLKRE